MAGHAPQYACSYLVGWEHIALPIRAIDGMLVGQRCTEHLEECAHLLLEGVEWLNLRLRELAGSRP